MPGSIVQIVGPGGASSAATSIVSSSITCTAGNQLWVIAISDDATISSITDSWSSGANTYTERGSVIEAAILRRLHHATCQIATGGTGTVTVNLGASVSNRQVWLVEVTGVGAYDAQGTATDTGNNPTDSASATNSAQPAFCVAAIVDYQGGTPTVGQISGSAATNGGSLAAGGQLGGLVEYRSVSTVTAQTANFGNAPLNRTCTVFAVFLEDSAPTISVHPADQTVNDGATATFSVTATGGATPYTYQWQDNSSGSFANVSGATSSSYGPTASYAAQGRQYRCVVTGANSLSVTSNAATLRVAFNTSGTGPRAYPILGGGPIGAGTVEAWLRGTDAGGAPSHATTGALAADAAALAGTATHLTLHATTGALSAQASTVSGAAQHQHATIGALSAQTAAIAGTAAHLTLHTTTGALSSQAAVIAGAAAHEHAASGALSSQAAAIAGAAAHEHAASGALSAQTAAVAGAATHFTLHTTTGALGAPDATIAGTAAHQHAATGALSAQAASIAGSADHTVAGATHTTTGALAAQDSTLTGSSAHLTLHSTTGALSAQESTVAGSAGHPHTTAGALSSQSAAVAGSAAHATLHATSGALGAQTASVSGAAAHEHATTGALAAGAAGIAGAALRLDAGVHATEGALQAQEATLSGSATLTPNPDNALTDPKFQGPSHNTRIRWERKRKEEAAAAEEPDLVKPPAPEPIASAPKPRSTGLGEITPPPVKVRAPEIKIPEIKVVAPAKTAAAEPEPAPAPAVAPAVKAPAAEVKPAAPPASPAITPADLARIEREMTAFVEGVVAGLTKQVAALDKMLQAKADELAAAQREIADLKRREVNRQRAEALARKIAEDDE